MVIRQGNGPAETGGWTASNPSLGRRDRLEIPPTVEPGCRPTTSMDSLREGSYRSPIDHSFEYRPPPHFGREDVVSQLHSVRVSHHSSIDASLAPLPGPHRAFPSLCLDQFPHRPLIHPLVRLPKSRRSARRDVVAERPEPFERFTAVTKVSEHTRGRFTPQWHSSFRVRPLLDAPRACWTQLRTVSTGPGSKRGRARENPLRLPFRPYITRLSNLAIGISGRSSVRDGTDKLHIDIYNSLAPTEKATPGRSHFPGDRWDSQRSTRGSSDAESELER